MNNKYKDELRIINNLTCEVIIIMHKLLTFISKFMLTSFRSL
jgi:hypothetical protein